MSHHLKLLDNPMNMTEYLENQVASHFKYLNEIYRRLTGEDCEFADMMALKHNLDRVTIDRGLCSKSDLSRASNEELMQLFQDLSAEIEERTSKELDTL